MSWMYRKKVLRTLTITALSILALLVTACSTGSTGSTGSTQGINPSSTASSSINNAGQIAQQKINDNHLDDTGYAHLTWTPQINSLSVTLNLSALVPNSTHPAHIHLGNCNTMANILYPLTNIVADNHGNYVGTTIIQNVKNGIPASGWYL